MADMVQLTAANSLRPGLRSASRLLYRKPALKTKFGERAFSYAGPAAWNSLPDYIQSDLNTNSLKKTTQNTFICIVILTFNFLSFVDVWNVCRSVV